MAPGGGLGGRLWRDVWANQVGGVRCPGGAAGAGSGAFADSGEGAPSQPGAGEDEPAAGRVAHSSWGPRRCCWRKPFDHKIKVGDKVTDAVPDSAKSETPYGGVGDRDQDWPRLRQAHGQATGQDSGRHRHGTAAVTALVAEAPQITAQHVHRRWPLIPGDQVQRLPDRVCRRPAQPHPAAADKGARPAAGWPRRSGDPL